VQFIALCYPTSY